MPLQDQNTIRALSQIDEQALIRLVYSSEITCKSRFQTSVFHDIEAQSDRFNKENNLTGTLCYGNGYFLQCLEGSKPVVIDLLNRIAEDNRHKHLKVLLVQPIESRTFFTWDMRLLFLERWTWSPKTKKKAERLSEFLPFKPCDWTAPHTNKFLSVIHQLETMPQAKTADIRFNALGNMLQHVVGPHQAFIMIQGALTILFIIALFLLFNTSFL